MIETRWTQNQVLVSCGIKPLQHVSSEAAGVAEMWEKSRCEKSSLGFMLAHQAFDRFVLPHALIYDVMFHEDVAFPLNSL